MSGTGKSLAAQTPFIKKGSARPVARWVSWVILVVAAVVLLALKISLNFAFHPAVAMTNNPDCMRDVAANEHTTVPDMFRDPSKHDVLKRAAVVC